MTNFEKLFPALGLALLSVVGCQREQTGDFSGEGIVFRAATEYRNGEGTRTEYSGEMVENRAYERIDWTPGEDRIRILSAQAENGPEQDYRITKADAGGRYSEAGVDALQDKLRWGTTGEHTFFGLYPAPGMKSSIGGTVTPEQASITLNAEGTEATVRGIIPSEQKGVWKDLIFKPDMNYAYMGAATTAQQGKKVVLSFQPLVTTLEFNLCAAGEEIASATLLSLGLSSSETPLTGSFTTNLKADNTHTEPELSGTGNQVTIGLGDGIHLSTDKTQTAKITVLTLPVDQTGLTATLRFRREDNTEFTRSLPLKDKEGHSIVVGACKKVYIWNLGVPDEVTKYEFEVTMSNNKQMENFPANPQAPRVYKVTSYKTTRGKESNTSKVAWSVHFETEDGLRPEWLNEFTESGEGSIEPESYNVGCTKNIELSKTLWPTVAEENAEMDRATDLSKKDAFHDSGNLRNTANCYVVTAPGWYKFPAVYGNALINDTANEKAYHYVGADGTISDVLDGKAFLPFLNSLGNAIQKPWVLEDTGKEGLEMEAVLCWQDRENLTSEWAFRHDSDGGYLYFYVDPKTISYGNAVIALREKGSSILWSWHIWVTENNPKLLGTTKIEVNPVVKPYAGVLANNILNVPVGWCAPEEFEGEDRETWVVFTQAETGKTVRFKISQLKTSSHSWGNHPFFQWGRKDPMLPATGKANEDKDKYQQGEDLKWTIKSQQGKLEQALQSPNVFINARPWFSGLEDEHHSFWDSGMGKRHANNYYGFEVECVVDRPVIKTVYDPCPVGYHVPNCFAFSIFSTATDLNKQLGTNEPKAPLRENGLEWFNSPEGKSLTYSSEENGHTLSSVTKTRQQLSNSRLSVIGKKDLQKALQTGRDMLGQQLPAETTVPKPALPVCTLIKQQSTL